MQLIREFTPKLHPKNVIIFIESQDINGMLDTATRGHSYFNIRDRQVTTEHSAYQESKAKQLLMHSSLIRYVFYNLKFPDWLSAKIDSLRDSPRKLGSDASLLQAARRSCVEYYFKELKTLSEQYGFRAIFLVDADRERIYKDGKTSMGWRSGDREWILQNIDENNFTVVDLQPVFTDFWKSRRERFDFQPIDGHWNSAGHGLAARELIRMLDRKH